MVSICYDVFIVSRRMVLRMKSSEKMKRLAELSRESEEERKPKSAKTSKGSQKKKNNKADSKKPKKPPTAFFYFLYALSFGELESILFSLLFLSLVFGHYRTSEFRIYMYVLSHNCTFNLSIWHLYLCIRPRLFQCFFGALGCFYARSVLVSFALLKVSLQHLLFHIR